MGTWLNPTPSPSSSVCVHLWRIAHVHLCMHVLSSLGGQQVPYSIKTGSLTESGARLAAGQCQWPSCLCPAQQVLLPTDHLTSTPPHLLTPYTLEEGGRQTNLIVVPNCLAELRILKIFIQNIKVWFGNQTVLIGTVLNKPHLLLSFYFF